MEIFHETKTLWVNYQCPHCQKGVLIANGNNFTPDHFGHKCNNELCGVSHFIHGAAYPMARMIANPEPMNPQPEFDEKGNIKF